MNELGASLEASSLSQLIKDVTWIIPLLQSIHIVTIGVVFVSSLMIAMRVLGRMRADEPFPVVWQRFAPWMWYGLIVMVVTGALLVVGGPVREFTAFSFWLKMALLAVAVIATFVFGRTFAAQGGGGAAPSTTRADAPAMPAGGVAAYAGAAGVGQGRSGSGGIADASGVARAVGVVSATGTSSHTAAVDAPRVASGSGVLDASGVAAAEFSPGAKAVAVGIIVVWLAVIFLGRAIAYDVEVWGSLSLHN